MINLQDFHFFPDELTVLQEHELAAHKRLNGTPAVTLEPVTKEDTLEVLEQEWLGVQEFIDTAATISSRRRSTSNRASQTTVVMTSSSWLKQSRLTTGRRPRNSGGL